MAGEEDELAAARRIIGSYLGRTFGSQNIQKFNAKPKAHRRLAASKGGKASSANMTEDQLRERARQAAAARWAKKRKKEQELKRE